MGMWVHQPQVKRILIENQWPQGLQHKKLEPVLAQHIIELHRVQEQLQDLLQVRQHVQQEVHTQDQHHQEVLQVVIQEHRQEHRQKVIVLRQEAVQVIVHQGVLVEAQVVVLQAVVQAAEVLVVGKGNNYL